MENNVCKKNSCTGCMACVNICPKNAISIEDSLDAYNAKIDKNKCIQCKACYNVCQINKPPKLREPSKWFQGYTTDDDIREKSSSGGIASIISKNFIENGGKVYSCTFSDGEFIFKRAEKKEDLIGLAGSKYVKSNPKTIFKNIKNDLILGNKVLFIGLPCQVGGLKKYYKIEDENLYTVDLICHGTPSPKILENFLNQYEISLKSISNINFRKKDKYAITNNLKKIEPNGVTDKYSIAFLNSLIFTENCYNCNYAKYERISDLTLGDSWGSEIKGISLILCQTSKGEKLISSSNIKLIDVDINKAVENNSQLRHPSVMTKNRKKFFLNLEKNRKFNNIIFWCLPFKCIKQNLKKILIKMKLIKIK